MSQRRKTQGSLSQPSTSSGIYHHEEDEEDVPRSQNPRNKTLSDAENAQYVANAVRYILAADQSKVPITRTALSKAIELSGAAFRSVMTLTEQVLEDVFGYRVVNIKNNDVSSGKFILVNKVQGSSQHLTVDEEVGNRYVFLFLVLSHIFMNGESCSEASLIKFLQNLGIIEEGNLNSEMYGNVLNLITNEFVKERYIKTEASENSEIQDKEYLWGERALEELSPRSVMEFACKMYGDREMQSWAQQYERMQILEREHHHVQRNGVVQNGHQ